MEADQIEHLDFLKVKLKYPIHVSLVLGDL